MADMGSVLCSAGWWEHGQSGLAGCLVRVVQRGQEAKIGSGWSAIGIAAPQGH